MIKFWLAKYAAEFLLLVVIYVVIIMLIQLYDWRRRK